MGYGLVLRILQRVSGGRGQDGVCQMMEDPGLTAEERGTGPAPLGPPILLDDDSGDARRCHEEGARAQPGNGASAVGAPGSRGPAIQLGVEGRVTQVLTPPRPPASPWVSGGSDGGWGRCGGGGG